MVGGPRGITWGQCPLYGWAPRRSLSKGNVPCQRGIFVLCLKFVNSICWWWLFSLRAGNVSLRSLLVCKTVTALRCHCTLRFSTGSTAPRMGYQAAPSHPPSTAVCSKEAPIPCSQVLMWHPTPCQKRGRSPEHGLSWRSQCHLHVFEKVFLSVTPCLVGQDEYFIGLLQRKPAIHSFSSLCLKPWCEPMTPGGTAPCGSV